VKNNRTGTLADDMFDELFHLSQERLIELLGRPDFLSVLLHKGVELLRHFSYHRALHRECRQIP
jgi:hypothetical protein